jgi:multidrug efflux pump subunit AcrA (membrane-fusion protein)
MDTSTPPSPRHSVNQGANPFARFWHIVAALSRRTQIIIVAVLLVVVGGIVVLAHGKSKTTADTALPTVTLESIGSFGDNANGVDALGTVQSLSEADLEAQSSGIAESVNTTLGATVPAGFVIAALDSSAASAAVLQAQGAYDAAVAAEQATNLQANNSTGSFAEEQTSVRTTYQTAYTSAESALEDNVGVFFGSNGPLGPELLINPLTTGNTLPIERRSLDTLMSTWQASLATENTTDPLTLLSTAESNLTTISTFLTSLATLANTQGSAATPAQLASLAAAQSTINGLLATISSTRTAYNTAATANAVGQTQASDSDTSGVTSSEATVEEALGGLRAAQAAYEKTVIRAPIAGTINYLQIHVGDNISVNQHVATVARNNALEVVLQLSQDDANRLAVGDTLTINGTDKGIVTTIAPALNPTTEQIEVDVAVNDVNGASPTDLVNGQSVQVTLPALAADASVDANSTTSTSENTSSTTSAVELPLTAVKLLPNERDVFTVDSTGHIIAHQVTIGDVIGDRIQILTPLPPDLEIVTDARGLSAGDAVLVSTSTATTESDD